MGVYWEVHTRSRWMSHNFTGSYIWKMHTWRNSFISAALSPAEFLANHVTVCDVTFRHVAHWHVTLRNVTTGHVTKQHVAAQHANARHVRPQHLCGKSWDGEEMFSKVLCSSKSPKVALFPALRPFIQSRIYRFIRITDVKNDINNTEFEITSIRNIFMSVCFLQ